MTKKSKKIIFLLLLFALIIFCAYRYVMVGGARNIATETTAFSTNTTQITAEFVLNNDIANSKYLEKPVAISGIIIGINNLEIMLDHNVICILNQNDEKLKIGQNVTIKGRVIGYDDLLTELKLDKCTVQ